MAANVWFIIWPNQKKIIAATTATATEGTPAPPDQPKWARAALLASRTNTMLSIPMLFFMVGAIHLPLLLVGTVVGAPVFCLSCGASSENGKRRGVS